MPHRKAQIAINEAQGMTALCTELAFFHKCTLT